MVPNFRLGHHATALRLQIRLLELLIKLQEILSHGIQLPVRLFHHDLFPGAPHIGGPRIPHHLISRLQGGAAISVCQKALIIRAVLVDLGIISFVSYQSSWGEVASS